MATSIASPTIPSTTSTSLANPLLEPAPDFLPDWPPILAIFLFSWLVMAWIVAVVLFLALFPEKVAWLDWWIERWREMGKRDRYVKRMMTKLEAYGGFDGLITLQAYFATIRRLCIQRLGVFHSRVYKSK
jgi:prepilin signal peptidase PulO-like enzyme (type II secretory pathway)